MRFKKFYIASTIAFIPSIIAVILWSSGMLDIRYLIAINLFSFLIEFAIFIIFINMVMRQANERSTIAIPKVSMHEKHLPAGKEIFEKYIVPVNPHNDCVFRVKVELKEDTPKIKITIIRKCQKGTCEDVLNNNISLDVGKVHIFDIEIDRKEKLNFKFDKDVTIKSFSIEEFYIVR